jgi:phosphomannomutase
MITASHNPKEYNGLKFCLAGAKPVGQDTGLREIRAAVEAPEPPPVPDRGSVERRDLLDRYVEHVLGFVDVDAIRPLRLAVDTANGMGGLVAPAVLERLPVTVTYLFPELDGTFPNHPADPIDPENQRFLRAAVTEQGADIGLAFDGDADRVFLVDERAEDVSGSLVTALVARAMLRREPGATILYNLICSWVVPEVIREEGGVPFRTRVGHSFIKDVMAETGAIFGGEHSGHYYFRENYRADSGLIAAVVVLGELSGAGVSLSELLRPFRRYFDSGEINSTVEDPRAKIEEIATALAEGRQDRLDGLTVEFDDWWCNVRPSNTEPLLRLNVEARTAELLEERTSTLLRLIRGPEGGDDT